MGKEKSLSPPCLSLLEKQPRRHSQKLEQHFLDEPALSITRHGAQQRVSGDHFSTSRKKKVIYPSPQTNTLDHMVILQRCFLDEVLISLNSLHMVMNM